MVRARVRIRCGTEYDTPNSFFRHLFITNMRQSFFFNRILFLFYFRDFVRGIRRNQITLSLIPSQFKMPHHTKIIFLFNIANLFQLWCWRCDYSRRQPNHFSQQNYKYIINDTTLIEHNNNQSEGHSTAQFNEPPSLVCPSINQLVTTRVTRMLTSLENTFRPKAILWGIKVV